jgi:UDP-glucuronate decarboxylase
VSTDATSPVEDGARPHAVVTGGAGFLGSHLVDALVADGYRVTTLDNYGSGRGTNLAHLDAGAVECLDHDVRDPFPAFDRVDHLYHFASRASPADFGSHGVEIAETNSLGTRHALECARTHGARVVLASTSEVYGDPEVHPQPETYNGNVNLRGPRAPYDESKRFAEALAGAYARRHGIDVRTVRIFNTYGPRMREDGRVVPTFLAQALADDDLTVYGDGSQTRSFCYVSDLVRGVRQFAEADPDRAANEVLNLGTTTEVTIRELADLVIDLFDADSAVVFEPLPEDDPTARRPDVAKAASLLDWSPAVGLEEGLRRTAAAFRERPAEGQSASDSYQSR